MIADFVDTIRDDGIRGKIMQATKVFFFADLLIGLSGRFAFHLQMLLRESLVKLDPSGMRYSVADSGRTGHGSGT